MSRQRAHTEVRKDDGAHRTKKRSLKCSQCNARGPALNRNERDAEDALVSLIGDRDTRKFGRSSKNRSEAHLLGESERSPIDSASAAQRWQADREIDRETYFAQQDEQDHKLQHRGAATDRKFAHKSDQFAQDAPSANQAKVGSDHERGRFDDRGRPRR